MMHEHFNPMSPLQAALVPTVIEQTGKGERAYDIFSRLLNDRIISWQTRSTIPRRRW